LDAVEAPVPPPAATRAGPTLVYDDDCPMCVALAARIVGAGAVPAARMRPVSAFTGDAAARIAAAGIAEEMVALDEATGETRSGLAALLWALRGGPWDRRARLLDRRPWRGIASALYRVVAYNRRLIAVPAARAAPCACEPSGRPGLRAAFLAACLALCAAVGAGVGATLPGALGHVARLPAGLAGIALAGAGPALAGLLGLLAPRGKRLAWLAHLVATTALGAAVVAPAALLAALAPPVAGRAGFAVALPIAVFAMLGAQRRRARWLGLRRRHVAAWAAGFLAGTAGAWRLVLG
jgi:hypothetical protein